mgnify:CR=1 FL=1
MVRITVLPWRKPTSMAAASMSPGVPRTEGSAFRLEPHHGRVGSSGVSLGEARPWEGEVGEWRHALLPVALAVLAPVLD